MTRTVGSRSTVVLFRGQYDFRTGNGTLAWVLPLVTSAVFTGVALSITADGNELTEWGFTVSAFLVGGIGFLALCNQIVGRKVYVEVSEDGIVSGNRFRFVDSIV